MLIELTTPNGLKAAVPRTPADDPSPHFVPDQLGEIREYYSANGYVVVRGALDPKACDAMRALWDAEVKPSAAPIYRQASARLESNAYNEQGWVMNPVLNPRGR